MSWITDLNAVSAWAAAAAVVVAIAALAIQVRQAAFNSSLDNLWHLEDRFNALADKRSVAANYLRLTAANDGTPAPAELDDVLDFFSLLGYLVIAGAIRRDAAWMRFSSWAMAYWVASREHINMRRERNPLYWRHAEQLVTVMERVETARLMIFDDTIRGLAWMPRGLRRFLSIGAVFVPKEWVEDRERKEFETRIADESSTVKPAAISSVPLAPN